MVKKILIFIFAFTFMFAVDNSLLLVEAKLYPKILYLLNKNPKKLKYAIIYNESTKTIAEKMKELLKNYDVALISKKDLKNDKDVYMITYKLDKKELETLIKRKKVIFSIFPHFIDSAMFSIYLDTRIKPFVNPYLLKKSGLSIDPIIFKVGKIYEK